MVRRGSSRPNLNPSPCSEAEAMENQTQTTPHLDTKPPSPPHREKESDSGNQESQESPSAINHEAHQAAAPLSAAHPVSAPEFSAQAQQRQTAGANGLVLGEYSTSGSLAEGGDIHPGSSSSASPKLTSRTPRLPTPSPPTSAGAGVATSSSAGSVAPSQHETPEMNRPLNVTDALSYLDAVKVQFQDKPDVYNHFLDIMKDFKSEVIDTPGVIERVSMLFHGNPDLIQGFNTFLPPGYRIDMSADPRDPNVITVTTPMGVTTQNTNTFGHSPWPMRDIIGPGKPAVPPHQLAFSGGPMHSFQSTSRPITPYSLAQMQQTLFEPAHDGFSPGIQGTSAVASFLGTLNNRNPVEKQPGAEFNHAIQYLNKIKARYADDADTYKQFLEILQAYQKEQRHLQDSQVYVQVQMLFKDAPDLLSEFKDFLPDAVGGIPAPGGLVGILPHPASGPGVSASWNQSDISAPGVADKAVKKTAQGAKKRRRAAEKDLTPGPSAKAGPNRTKKAKHHHKEADSPRFSPYSTPLSPQHVSTSHVPLSAQASSAQQGHVTQPLAGPSHAAGPLENMLDEAFFFERVKKSMDSRETYEEFLKLLNLYARDIIDLKTAVSMSQAFLGDGELYQHFRDIVNADVKLSSIDNGPRGSIRMAAPEPLSSLPAEIESGPSYRKLRDSETRLACSGRDELCRSVLNDQWVSHPTWASEEVGFNPHKKNTYEEILHKSEEERHEIHVHLEALTRTIALLEPISMRIEEMSSEERIAFRLPPNLSGPSPSLYQRTIKKIYGREPGLEILQALQDSPHVAVPVVLARLKQKDDEWRRAQREWNKTWREVESKNFYKSLDHIGIGFKQTEKKTITAKHFVGNIELLKEEQARSRKAEDQPSFAYGSLGPQLEFSFHDVSVMQDALKLTYSFLDHAQSQYSLQERRALEKFLRVFIPTLCMCPPNEFDGVCEPLVIAMDVDVSNEHSNSRQSAGADQSAGVPANDLRKQLLKTMRENAFGFDIRDPPSATLSRAASPTAVTKSDETDHAKSADTEDFWIRESACNIPTDNFISDASRRRPFFANTTFYMILCYFQSLYSRLLICKEVGAQRAAEKHAFLDRNPIAIELGLDDPNGPSALLAQAVEAFKNQPTCTNVLYMYLLDACEKMFDGELDQSVFEEHMRWFFGNKAYHLFTLDKIITALVKQVQTVLSDNRCQELWLLLQRARQSETLSNQDMIRYRREAERHVGSDDHLYRIDWRPNNVMCVQLLEADDPSVDEGSSSFSRWREYVDSYVLRQPSEWMPQQRKTKPGNGLFLRRHLGADERPEEPGCGSWNAMRIRISLGTYKLFYEGGAEDAFVRVWGAEEGRELRERARLRHEERMRSRWQQEWWRRTGATRSAGQTAPGN